jgi:hypothetical protein
MSVTGVVSLLFTVTVHSGPETHSVNYPVGTGALSPEVKWLDHEVENTTI